MVNVDALRGKLDAWTAYGLSPVEAAAVQLWSAGKKTGQWLPDETVEECRLVTLAWVVEKSGASASSPAAEVLASRLAEEVSSQSMPYGLQVQKVLDDWKLGDRR